MSFKTTFLIQATMCTNSLYACMGHCSHDLSANEHQQTSANNLERHFNIGPKQDTAQASFVMYCFLVACFIVAFLICSSTSSTEHLVAFVAYELKHTQWIAWDCHKSGNWKQVRNALRNAHIFRL